MLFHNKQSNKANKTQGFTKCERTEKNKDILRAIKEQELKKKGITTVISLKNFESWERVPRERIAREETVSTEVTVRSRSTVK